MSTPVQNTTKLPNETAIQKYVMDHTLFTTAVSTGLLVTNLLPAIVKYLAGQEIASDQIQKNVQEPMDSAVQTSSEEDQKKTPHRRDQKGELKNRFEDIERLYLRSNHQQSGAGPEYPDLTDSSPQCLVVEKF